MNNEISCIEQLLGKLSWKSSTVPEVNTLIYSFYYFNQRSS